MTTQTQVRSTEEALSIEDTSARSALKLALEALEQVGLGNYSIEREAKAAIKKALAQPKQEPVGFAVMQKPWVGLTDEEFEDIELGCRSTPFGKIEAMRMVEAKLRSKNT